MNKKKEKQKPKQKQQKHTIYKFVFKIFVVLFIDLNKYVYRDVESKIYIHKCI